jgi:uncharacterized protein (DUF488 family)
MENAPDPSAIPDPPPGLRGTLLSVGHSNHDWPAFLALLRGAGVTAVADVRSSPCSRRLPHFNRDALEAALRAAGIAYVFLGDLLGGRPRDRGLYGPDGRVDYERVRQTDAFRRGIGRLTAGLGRHTVALLCSEEDPLDCHRGLMIAPALAEMGIPLAHLRKDGSVETREDIERRLLGDDASPSLFPGERLAAAYRRMAGKKAYRLRVDEDGE